MRGHRINSLSGRLVFALALVALLTVLTGYFQPAQADEGAGAHIFQITIVLLAPVLLLFLLTMDWKRPLRGARPLAVPATMLVLAFGALYYLERCWYR